MSTAFATVFLYPSTSADLSLPEAAKALERAWQRRRQELAGWQPSNGWLIGSHNAAKRATTAQTKFAAR
jgi:hypothetical protein